MKKTVIIIGTGPGGLATGMLLAHRGYDVTILEKADVIGGRNAAITVGEYTFDTGPTFLHQKVTLDEIFAEVDCKPEDYMNFVNLNPMTRLNFGDISLDTSSDRNTMAQNIEEAFPGESKNYFRFMDDHAKKLNVIFPCLQRPYHKLSSYFNSKLYKAIPYVATRKSVMEILGEYFTDDRLKLAFTFQSKYLGMSPWKCPALFSILSYIEYEHGIYHVQGGLSKISQVMAEIFQEKGGKIMLDSEVSEIKYIGKKATHVILKKGNVMACDDIVINADYAAARNTIFGKYNISEDKLKKKKYSCSTFMLYLGLDKIYENEPHHHIIFADNYSKNLEEIQNETTVSKDPSIYIRNSSITDTTVAPEGHSQLYILVPTINLRHGSTWDETISYYRDLILDRVIEKTGMKDLRNHIVKEHVITPADWQKSNIFMGATFNLAHTLDQMLYFRPQNKLKGFKNIYLAGGGTHPGSGLPTIYESARISANLICENYGDTRKPVDFTSSILEEATKHSKSR